ncbi:MAG: hypothetical protein JXB62_09020 [Pirellulales bacterium]|nr:hypothetical protein [Pirellulales bacterium]
MAIHVLCPSCQARYEVGDERAGETATCPTCGQVARIPDVYGVQDQTVAGGRPSQASPYASPYYTGQAPVSAYGGSLDIERASAAFEPHRVALAVFGIVAGAVNLLWTCFCLFGIFIFVADVVPQQQAGPAGAEVAAGMYAVMGVLSAVTGVLQIAAATYLLRRKRRARTLGIVAAAVSCAGIWGCCAYPVSFGFGIYALVVLCARNAMETIERWAA